MSDPKQPVQPGFLSKVAKFVANPTVDWRDLNSRPEDAGRDGGYDKEELKAMIERKQRNDFVRRRELDMLRKIRREGLTGDALAGVNMSHLDDSEPPRPSRVDGEVKAKIDAIEKQMVGESFPSSPPARHSRPAHPPPPVVDMFEATTLPGDAVAVPTERPPLEATEPMTPMSLRTAPVSAPMPATPSGRPVPAFVPEPSPAPVKPAAKAAPRKAMSGDFGDPFAVEVTDITHDPELDEAVIAFANADFEQCERALTNLVRGNGPRGQHAETWLVLFDFYRAIGQQAKFESLAIEYAQTFGWSAPQWFSLPQLVAQATSQADSPRAASTGSTVGWVCPSTIDIEAVKKLRTHTLQLPMPWVLDWSQVKAVEPEACGLLCSLLRVWSRDPIDMQWMGANQLFHALTEATPVSLRDVDPSVWLLKLEVLRLANRPDQFDVAAIDYCVTYEVSPPSWEVARCTVRMVSESGTGSPASVVSEMSTGFVESQTHDDPSMGQVATVELTGQLVGDISGTLRALQSQFGSASAVHVTCSRLIRVDFIAAGDLLNWVLSRREESREVLFEDAHRLVALFFGAMGINEHAKVKVRNI